MARDVRDGMGVCVRCVELRGSGRADRGGTVLVGRGWLDALGGCFALGARCGWIFGWLCWARAVTGTQGAVTMVEIEVEPMARTVLHDGALGCTNAAEVVLSVVLRVALMSPWRGSVVDLGE